MPETTTAPRAARRGRPPFDTFADLLKALGGISPKRIGMDPPPGTATEKDVVRWLEGEPKRLYELVYGTLVEKAMSVDAAFVAGIIIQDMRNYSEAHGDLGMVLGADGAMRLLKGLIRIPDVSFTPWARLPGGRVPAESVPDLVPDLAIEVLSPSNTRGEMILKRADYFRVKIKLVWLIDPPGRWVRVYTDPDTFTELGEADTLDGGEVLTGFRLPVARLFARLAPQPPNPTRHRKKKPG